MLMPDDRFQNQGSSGLSIQFCPHGFEYSGDLVLVEAVTERGQEDNGCIDNGFFDLDNVSDGMKGETS